MKEVPLNQDKAQQLFLTADYSYSPIFLVIDTILRWFFFFQFLQNGNLGTLLFSQGFILFVEIIFRVQYDSELRSQLKKKLPHEIFDHVKKIRITIQDGSFSNVLLITWIGWGIFWLIFIISYRQSYTFGTIISAIVLSFCFSIIGFIPLLLTSHSSDDFPNYVQLYVKDEKNSEKEINVTSQYPNFSNSHRSIKREVVPKNFIDHSEIAITRIIIFLAGLSAIALWCVCGLVMWIPILIWSWTSWFKEFMASWLNNTQMQENTTLKVAYDIKLYTEGFHRINSMMNGTTLHEPAYSSESSQAEIFILKLLLTIFFWVIVVLSICFL
ncbi:MAG TPA: hypothetical protein VE978_11270 [Chitinophagales bacterium]|nr:hypothetical protein [Chitinophagales bacterium]